MKRRLPALLLACGSLPMVKGYLRAAGFFLLQVAILLLLAAGDPPAPPPAS